MAFWLDGELSLVIRGRGRRLMSKDVTDQSLLDVSGLDLGESLDESALSKVLKRILTVKRTGTEQQFSGQHLKRSTTESGRSCARIRTGTSVMPLRVDR